MRYTLSNVELHQVSRAYRAAHNITQAQLADMVGVGVASIRRWESGQLPARGRHLTAWSDVLGVNHEGFNDGTWMPDRREVKFDPEEVARRAFLAAVNLNDCTSEDDTDEPDDA